MELDTAEAQQSLQFAALPQKKGYAVVIAAVAEGSEAWREGVRMGNPVTAVSDPVRADEVWQLSAMSSARFVRDAVRMRRSPTLRLDVDSSRDLFAEQKPQAAAAAAAAAAAPAAPPAAAAGSPSSLLDAVTESMQESSGSESDDGGDASRPRTVAERLEREYRAKQAKTNAVQERMDRRKEYLGTVKQRNDAPLFLAVAGVFLVPPVAILLWAFFSGYLDQLATKY